MVTDGEIAELLARLAAMPARFAAACGRFEEADAVMHPAAGEWSPEEVLAHLRAAHDITEPRILAILTRDNPPLPAFDERRWQEVACYLALPMTESLETLRLRRHELVQALHALPAAAWMRTGRHEERGPLTVLEIAQDIAFHDEEHCIQVERMTTNGGE
jgi:hypothetical protein